MMIITTDKTQVPDNLFPLQSECQLYSSIVYTWKECRQYNDF